MRLQFGDNLFDSDARALQRGGREARISGKAFQLLQLLLERRPDPIAKEELFQSLWPDTFVSEANLASLVKEIRAAIGDDAKNPRFIRTAHRFGYSFAGEATELPREQKAIDSIAVLPFAAVAGSADGDYLGDGLAEALINSLASVPGLRVAPRGSSFAFRGREEELDAIRRQLNVKAIITGRLRLAGDSLSLQVELTDVARNDQIFGKQYQAPLQTPFVFQEELSRDIAARLRLPLSGEAARRLTRHYTSSSTAYQQYLIGRHHWNRRTLEGIERAIFYFQAAVDADPKFAPAYSGLADSYIALASRDLHPPLQLLPRAEAAARKALDLDPDLAEAHASLGAIDEVFEWNWEESRREFDEALRLNPSYQVARIWYALALAHRAEFEPALAQIEAAREQEPLSVIVNSTAGTVLYVAGDFVSAEKAFATALEVNPYHEPTHFARGLALLHNGNPAGAEAELERAHQISKGEPHNEAALGHLAAVRGDRIAADKRLQRLREQSVTRHVSPVHFAMIHTGLAEYETAFEWLDRAVESRSGWLVFLRTEPRFAPLRDDPRFARLVKLVGLE